MSWQLIGNIGGRDGRDGKSVEMSEIHASIEVAVMKAVAAIPRFTGAVVNREGHLVLTLSNGEWQDVGPVIGRDGASGLDGKDAVGAPGKDGLGFDDYDLYLDETRGWIMRLEQGERCKEWVLGIPFDARVYEAGKVYPKGAGTTWDGHYWIALAQTSDAPGEGSSAWRLVVRRGKQGREGKQGKQGDPGHDYTQLGSDGKRW